MSTALRNIDWVTICQVWCKNIHYSKPEGENVDVLNQGGVGGGLNICDVKERKMIRSWDVKFVVGEVLAGHLAKSYKVGREARLFLTHHKVDAASIGWEGFVSHSVVGPLEKMHMNNIW